MEHESALPTGFRFDEYELVRVLGAGGFGITYLGYDHNLDKPMAIKEYLPNDLAVRKGDTNVVAKSSADQGDFAWGMERFLEEARVLAQFDHPNMPKVYRFFEKYGTGYIVMEYVEGETLSAHYKQRGAWSHAELKKMALPLLAGLETIHLAGYLHRDIKPANIVIRDDGSPVLIDFGSARAAIGAKSRSITAIITPGYAPIEQYSTKGNQGPWTDIYALGAVLYRGVSGKTPDDAASRILNDELTPLAPGATSGKGGASSGDDAFLAAIDWALQLREAERPPDIAQWRAMLTGEKLKSAAKAVAPRQDQPAPSGTSSTSQQDAQKSARQWVGEMVAIPTGHFRMGDLSGFSIGDLFGGFFDDDKPVHTVSISPFEMGAHTVTVGQFRAFVADSDYDAGNDWHSPGFTQSDRHPVVCVSYEDAQAFIGWLKKKSGGHYRLPTEAEWEYAARAGTTSQFSWGDSESQADAYAWYGGIGGNSGDSTHAVGGKQANPWGLYDMHGNVWEWVADWYAVAYYASSPATDPQGPGSGQCHVLRGGSWGCSPRGLRSADRGGLAPANRFHGLGVRLVQDITPSTLSP